MKSLYFAVQTLSKPFFILCLLAFSTQLYAQPAATLSVQGVLTKSDGTAVDDDNYTVNFRLYDAPTGGNQTHFEPIEVETIGGVYSVVLGNNPAYPLNAAFDKIYYLSVSIGSSELTPRPQLTHAPYALSLIGQNNTFPSTGNVLGDAFRAKGGGTTGGYGFQGFDGGMFSSGAGNLSLYSGTTEKVKLGVSLNELFGKTHTNELVVFGPLTSNDHNINGSQQVNGSQTVTGNQTVNFNQTIGGSSQINSTQTINGASLTKSYVKTYGRNEGGGFTFNYPNVIDDTDSGLFGGGDGNVQIRANGTLVAEFTTAQGYTNQCCNNPASAVKFFGIQKGPDNPQVEWDEQTGHLQVDNSSRRLKRNIVPMTDDFRLILKVQPKLYNRIGYPDNLVELGYIAEEFDSIGLTRLVHYNGSGEITGVNYKKVSIYLAEVVKVHENEIESLKAELTTLKAANTQLQSENAALRVDNNSMQKQQSAFSAQLEALSKRMQSLESIGNSIDRK